MPLSHPVPDASSHCPPGVCVGAVLGDALRRVAVLGGLRGVESRVIAMPGVKSNSNGVAVSSDSSTLLVSDGSCHSIREFRVPDGSSLRLIGCVGDGPLQFRNPYQVWVAPDDHVFIADRSNNRVQVLTPALDFHAFVGVGQLSCPVGVCADDDVVAVSEEFSAHRISVFSRCDGGLLRRFGSRGSGDGQLQYPAGLCFLSGHRHVAVADTGNHRVSLFSVDGEFIRHVGVGKLKHPSGVACSAFDEIVVADWGHYRVVVFSASGEMLHTMGGGVFTGVAMHGGTIFAQQQFAKCTLFN